MSFLSMRGIKFLGDNIFWIAFEEPYEMAMHVLRVQEFFESRNEQFRGKVFNLIDFMRWYANNISENGVFSYPMDYAGFNFSSQYLRGLYAENIDKIPDFNEYDAAMTAIMNFLDAVCGKEEQYYVLWTLPSDTSTFKHEYAHALFAQNPTYKIDQTRIVESAPRKLIDAMRGNLVNAGYSDEVHLDEIQAVLATKDDCGYLTSGMKSKKDIKELAEKLEKNFEYMHARIDHLFHNFPA